MFLFEKYFFAVFTPLEIDPRPGLPRFVALIRRRKCTLSNSHMLNSEDDFWLQYKYLHLLPGVPIYSQSFRCLSILHDYCAHSLE